MSSRERILAAVVILLLGCFTGVFVWDQVSSMFRVRHNDIAELQRQIQDNIDRQEKADSHSDRMASLNLRSLPRRQELARHLYQEWLLRVIKEEGLEEKVNLDFRQVRPFGDAYYQIAFNVNGAANLNELTQFLFRFYSVNYLHRISEMSVQVNRASNELSINLTIQALVLPGASDDTELVQPPGQRLVYDDKSRYVSVITGRNIFGFPNKAPRLNPVADQTAHLNQPFSMDITASDEDEADTVTFSLADGSPDGATIDSQSGKFSWTPREVGNHDITVIVTDDGSPSLTAQQTMKITVDKLAKAKESDEGSVAKVKSFTGGARREVWIQLEKSGKLLVLAEGEKFEAGGMQGIIKKIGKRDVQLVFNGQPTLVAYGESLPKTTSDAVSGE